MPWDRQLRRCRIGTSEAREQANLTMEALAEKLDLSRSAIGAFESGRKLPSQPVLQTILRECGALEKFEALDELRSGWPVPIP